MAGGQKLKMKKAIYILSVIILILGGIAAALWLPHASSLQKDNTVHRFGRYEGLELVYKTNSWGDKIYAVEDAGGRQLFSIPLHNCLIDTRFRDGRLRFRENGTNREGFIDDRGNVTFFSTETQVPAAAEAQGGISMPDGTAAQETPASGGETSASRGAGGMTDSDLRGIANGNPFYNEAVKVLSGRLSVKDGNRRRVILNYCEHLRAAYTTKDIDFLKQIFSEHALIIVGNVVKTSPSDEGRFMTSERVKYNIRTKKEYITRLGKAFADSKNIDVKFSDFRIMRHPTMDGIYGVILRQKYKSDRYADDGYLFLLWDFRNESMPCIHVRTWQPSVTVSDDNDIISIGDFNLE